MASAFGAKSNCGKSFRIDDLLQRKKANHSEETVTRNNEVVSDLSRKTWSSSSHQSISSNDAVSSLSSQSISNPRNRLKSELHESCNKETSVVKESIKDINEDSTHSESSTSSKSYYKSSKTSELHKVTKTMRHSEEATPSYLLNDRDKRPLHYPHNYTKDHSVSPSSPKHVGHVFVPPASQGSEISRMYPPYIGGLSAHVSSSENFIPPWSAGGNGLESILAYHNSNLGMFNSSNLFPNLFVPGSSSPQLSSIWATHPLMQNPSYLDPRAVMERGFHPSSSHLASPFGIPYMSKINPLLGLGSKRKGGQIRFSNSQTTQLEKAFRDHKYLNANDRKTLAHSLGLSDKQVKTWFQNRRAKYRKSKDDGFYDKEHEESDRISPAYSPGENPATYQSRGPTI